MGYQQNNYNKKNFNNNRGERSSYKTQRDDRPKNETFTFPLTVTGTNANGRTYDVNAALANLETLKDNNTFTMLSVPVHISRALLENDETRRGTTNIGFIKDLSIIDLTTDVTIHGKFVETIKGMNLEFVPRVLITKDGNIATFLGFDLLAAE